MQGNNRATNLCGKMIADFLERGLCVSHDFLYPLQLLLRGVDRLMLGHTVPVIQSVWAPHHEVRASEGTAGPEPPLGSAGAVGEPTVPAHIVHLLLEPAPLGPVHPLLLLHQPELLLAPLPELIAGLAALHALLLDLTLPEAGLNVHHEVRVHLLLVLQPVPTSLK